MARERATDTATLVRAAATVFRLKGYRKATIDDIAEAAGISRPTVYAYIRSKQHLLDLMVDEVTGAMDRQLDELSAGTDPAAARLRRFVDGHIAEISAHREFWAILFSEEVELSERSRHLFRSAGQRQTDGLRSLLESHLGAGSQVDPGIAANLVMSMLSSLYRWYDPAGRVGPDLLSQQIALLLAGLTPSD